MQILSPTEINKSKLKCVFGFIIYLHSVSSTSVTTVDAVIPQWVIILCDDAKYGISKCEQIRRVVLREYR